MNNYGVSEISLSARALNGIRWSFLSTFSKSLLSLLVLVVLARLLTPIDFGLLGIAWIFIALGVRFGQAGIGPAVVQRDELTDRHIQVGFTLSLAFGIVVMAIVWLFAPLVGELFNEPIVSRLLQVLSVIFVINGVGVIPTHLLRRNLQFRQLMVARILAYSIGYGFTAVVLSLRGFGVWSLVWGEIMRAIIFTTTVIWYSPDGLRPHWARREATDLLSRGVGFSLARIFEFIARQGSLFVVGRWLGAMSLGYYTRADRLILLSKNYVSNSLSEVLFPAMAQRQQRKDRLASIYLHGKEILAMVALPVSALLFFSAPEIVSVILGGQWAPVVILLQILAFTILFQMCSILNVAAAGAIGAVYRQAWRQGVHAFLVVGGSWFATRWGLEGVAVAIVGTQVIGYLLLTQLTVSLLEMRWRRLLRCFLPALWTGVWTAATLWLTTSQLRTMHLPAGLLLFIEVLVWIVTIIAALHYAPSVARSISAQWVVANMPFEVLGTPGYYLRRGLQRLLRC